MPQGQYASVPPVAERRAGRSRQTVLVGAETMLLLVLGAIAAIVAVRWVADRTGLPAAALLTVVGIAYALLPGPNVTLDPDLILTLVIPPLLYSAALDSSLLAIRRNLRTVVSLSVLLVLATALVIGIGFAMFVAGCTLAAGIALGAAVAPPDPVAALACGRKAGLPPRLITIVQGEGLLNDATALTILSVAVAAAQGDGFSTPAALGQFLLAAAGGVATGVAVAYGVRPPAASGGTRCRPTRSPSRRRSSPTCSPSPCTSPACWPSSSPG